MEALAKLKAALGPDGAPWIEPPTLLPLRRVLDLVGERLSDRLVLAGGLDGPEQCLRPDMTLPTALYYAAEATPEPRAYRYSGRVYRSPGPGGPSEVESTTIGMERFGEADEARVDAEVLAAALDACAALDLPPLSVKMTDLRVFGAALDAFGLEEPIAGRLQAVALRPSALLERLERSDRTLSPSDPARALFDLPTEEARIAARAMAQAAVGAGPMAGRDVEQIAERLVDKALAARQSTAPDALKALMTRLMRIKGSPEKVLDARLGAFSEAGMEADAYFETAHRRLDRIRGLQPGLELYVDPTFEGNFWYYDGFLFSVRPSGGGGRVLAAGGRYDSLVSRLTEGANSAPAAGCSLFSRAILETVT